MGSLYPRLASVTGVLMVVAAGAIVRLGDLSTRIPLFFLLFAAIFAVYLTAVVVLPRLTTPRRQTLALVWIVAIACRLILLGASPSLSDDVYRYLWEGRIITAGYNPFSHPPDAQILEPLRDDNYQSINHKHLETIYPPLAQAVFALAAFVRADVATQKFFFMLFDLAILAVIILLLRQRGMNPALSVVYGWSPLVLVEFAHSGHMDAIAIFFLMLAIYLFGKKSRGHGMVAIGLSFLAKLTPLVLAPYFLMRNRLLVWAPLAIGVVVAGYLPFAGAGDKLWSSLGVYGLNWNFNSLIYHLLEWLWDNPTGIRMLLAGVVVIYAFYQARREKDLLLFAFRVIACALLLSPTVYPWYITWVVPFLCFSLSRAWLYLSGVVIASYVVWTYAGAGGEWRLATGFLFLEYVPFYVILLYEYLQSRRARA